MNAQGKYLATVVSVDDPEKRGRVQFISSASGSNKVWAEPCYQFGGAEDFGEFHVPIVGSTIWIEKACITETQFKYVWSGTATSYYGSKASLPYTFLGNKVLGMNFYADRLTLPDGTKITSPAPSYNPTYPHNWGWKSESGMTYEVDDTPNNTRYAFFHPHGYSAEVNHYGFHSEYSRGSWRTNFSNETVHVYGDSLEVYQKGFTEVHYGNYTLNSPSASATFEETIGGSKTVTVSGEYNLTTGERTETTYGSVTSEISGTQAISCSKQVVSIGGTASRMIMGAFQDYVYNTQGEEYAYRRTIAKGSELHQILLDGDHRIDVVNKGDIVLSCGLTKSIPMAPQSRLLLGGTEATEPAVCGNMLMVFLASLMAILSVPAGASTAPGTPIAINPGLVAFTVAANLTYLNPVNMAMNILSNHVFIDKGLIPSVPALPVVGP